MWLPATDPDFPWTGILLGAPILGVWYWCTDQFIVQRVLAAKDLDNARGGTIFAGFLKLLPVFAVRAPGRGGATPWRQQGKLALDSPDHALPTLVTTLLPAGLRGVVVAGLLAALMSSLSSVFNSCSTLVTFDIYRKIRPGASDRQLVVVGQVATGGLVVLAMLWIPLMSRISGQLYQYLQSVQAYISPPIAAVFLLGLFWTRVNARGAMAALGTGFVLGALRLVLELNNPGNLSGLVHTYATMNFLHFAALLFAICVAVMVVASLSAPPPSAAQLAGLTYATAGPRVDSRHRGLLMALSWLVVAGVGLTWWIFRG